MDNFIIGTFFTVSLFPDARLDRYTEEQEQLMSAIIMVESSGDDKAIGDNGKAICCMQIHFSYFYDSTEYTRMGGEYRDCFNRDFSKRIFDGYMKRYAKEAWTDPASFDPEKVARIHNGGPRGYRKKATINYWRKVKDAM